MENLSSIVNGMSDKRDAIAVLNALKGVYDRFRSICFSDAGLVITATTGKKTAKTGASITYGHYKGKLFSIAAGTDMPNPVGTVADGTSNVFVFYVTAAGASITATSMAVAMGTAGATIDLITFPKIPEGAAVIGFMIVTASGSAFTGGTTALDAANITTVYISTDNAFDWSATY